MPKKRIGAGRSRNWEERMAAEFQFHLESQISEYLQQGLSREEAESRARREFGAVELAKEECRERRLFSWLDNLRKDLHFALRSLRRTPGFTVVAMLTLASGIGANTAVFSLIHAFLLRSLPYPHSQELVKVVRPNAVGDVTAPEYQFFKEHSPIFLAAAATRGVQQMMMDDGSRQQWARSLSISNDFFQTLGIKLAVGREFRANETQPNGPKSVVLSDRIWREYFKADRQVLGRTISIDKDSFTVVGVLPGGFWFPEAADLFMPIHFGHTVFDLGTNTDMIARLRPGVGMRDGQAALDFVAKNFNNTSAGRENDNHRGLRLLGFQQWLIRDFHLKLMILFGAVALLLLIACLNISSLLMARLAARRKEIAVRRALGGSSQRLFQQFLAENLLLTLGGSLCGLLVAAGLMQVVVPMLPFQPQSYSPVSLDVPVLLFALALSLAMAILLSLMPFLTSAKLDIQTELRGARQNASAAEGKYATRSFLLVGEIALSVILLVGAALLIQSLILLYRQPLGFSPENVMTFSTTPSKQQTSNPIAMQTFISNLREAIGRLPGVHDVAAINQLPLDGQNNYPTQREGHPEQSIGGMEIRVVTPSYFEAMKIPVERGRLLSEGDNSSAAPAVLINRTLANRWWANSSPMGDRLILGLYQGKSFGEAADVPRQVVGVVSDTKTMLATPPRPTVYIPYRQAKQIINGMSWVVRSESNPRLAEQLRAIVASLDSHQRVQDMRMMTQLVAASTADSRLNSWLFGSFAALALALSAVGIYGLLAFAVAQRTNEIGIRMALGATRGETMKLILRQGMILIASGLAIGLISASVLTRYLSSLLYQVQPNDIFSYAAIALLLLTVGMIACYLPARQATSIDPMNALRSQ